MDLGFPDICLTPMPVPVPIPYPNMGLGPIGIIPAFKILFMCAPAHNMLTFIPISMLDFSGVALGVASGMVMGPVRHLTASFTTLLMGLPCTRMTSIAIQNSTNCPGIRIVPSQPKILVLAP